MTRLYLALLLLASLGAGAQVSDPVARQIRTIESLERRWLASEDDPSALETILADDFIHVLPAGFVTKREQLDYMRGHPAPAAGGSKRFEDLRVRVYCTAAVATGIVVATAADGHVRKTMFTDVFVYRDGRWQAVNAQELPG
jgi:hypothetical protein